MKMFCVIFQGPFVISLNDAKSKERKNRNISIFCLMCTGRGSAAFYFILLSDQHTNPYIIECGCVYWLSSSTSSHVHVVWPTHSKEFSCYPVHRHSYSIPFFMVFYVYSENGAFFTPFSFGMWMLFVYYWCLFVVISSIIATRFIPLLVFIVRCSSAQMCRRFFFIFNFFFICPLLILLFVFTLEFHLSIIIDSANIVASCHFIFCLLFDNVVLFYGRIIIVKYSGSKITMNANGELQQSEWCEYNLSIGIHEEREKTMRKPFYSCK